MYFKYKINYTYNDFKKQKSVYKTNLSFGRFTMDQMPTIKVIEKNHNYI